MIKEIIDAWKNFILGTYELLFVPHQEWKSKPETFRSFCLFFWLIDCRGWNSSRSRMGISLFTA